MVSDLPERECSEAVRQRALVAHLVLQGDAEEYAEASAAYDYPKE